MVRLFFNIWPLATMKIIHNMFQICQSRPIILKKRNKLLKNCQRLVKFCQIGEISPNLVTLKERTKNDFQPVASATNFLNANLIPIAFKSFAYNLPSFLHTSVTRWRNNFSNIWPFIFMKICPIAKRNSQSKCKNRPNTK